MSHPGVETFIEKNPGALLPAHRENLCRVHQDLQTWCARVSGHVQRLSSAGAQRPGAGRLKTTWSVISDLHLFTARSVTHRFMDGIVQAMDESEALVLNGDILDFNWSIAGDAVQTMAAGERWLRELTAGSSCRIIYVLGNHDGFAEWARRCETLARELPSLEFSPDYYRVGDTLFTHGDLLMGPAPVSDQGITRANPAKTRLAGCALPRGVKKWDREPGHSLPRPTAVRPTTGPQSRCLGYHSQPGCDPAMCRSYPPAVYQSLGGGSHRLQ